MIISFNSASGFVRQFHEKAEEAIMRQIVRQLINRTTFTENELQGLLCRESVFNTFLDQQTHFGSSSETPFILLIDELTQLGVPFSSTVLTLLQRLFLRKNRYLVYTTHFSFTLSVSMDIKFVRMLQCNDLSELRRMEGCAALAGHEATIYGGIPALVYSVINHLYCPLGRFAQAMMKFDHISPEITFRANLKRSLWTFFIQELLNDRRIHGNPELRFFDHFSSIPEPGRVRWPLCYLSEILNILKVPDSGIERVIEEIYIISRRDSQTFVSLVETGLAWQSVVDVAVLLRALDALLWRGKHPLVPALYEVKSVTFVPMPDECRTLPQGQQFIASLPPQKPGHLYVIRSSHAKFPLFDGFLVAVLPPTNSKQVIEYQVKLERHIPRETVLDWVNGGGFLIRDLAPASSNAPSKWMELYE